MTGLLQGKTAIVTGGAGGIGRALVRALVGEGANVAIVDVAHDALASFGKELAGAGMESRFLPVPCDISDANACEECVARTIERFGGVDILVNNAAIGMGAVRVDHMTELVRIHEITPHIWQQFLDVNLSGAFYMTRTVMPHLLDLEWGRVINVTTSFFTMLRAGFYPYGAAKAGLEAMSAGHAQEFAGTGVTVNIVVPGGPADTPMVPPESGFERDALIAPASMGPPVLWLCSEEANETTGYRFVAAHWDPALPAAQAAREARSPVGWPELARNPVWPGGAPPDG